MAHPKFGEMLNLLNRIIASHFILFSADADVRLARRIRRDTVEKARDIAAVLDQVIFFYHQIFPKV